MTKREKNYAARIKPTNASKPAKPVFNLYDTEAPFLPDVAEVLGEDEVAVLVAAGRVEVTTGDVALRLAETAPC